MSSETFVDHPGQMSWFVGHGPAPVLGPCPHGCEHNSIGTIAWGPDEAHYELVVCDGEGWGATCGGECRAWITDEQSSRGTWKAARWLQVDVEHEDPKTLENRYVEVGELVG